MKHVKLIRSYCNLLFNPNGSGLLDVAWGRGLPILPTHFRSPRMMIDSVLPCKWCFLALYCKKISGACFFYLDYPFQQPKLHYEKHTMRQRRPLLPSLLRWSKSICIPMCLPEEAIHQDNDMCLGQVQGSRESKESTRAISLLSLLGCWPVMSFMQHIWLFYAKFLDCTILYLGKKFFLY